MKKWNEMKLTLGFLGFALLIGLFSGASLFRVPTELKAEETPVYTLDTTGSLRGSNSSYSGNCDVEAGGIVWNFEGNTRKNPWRIGGQVIPNGTYSSAKSKTGMPNAIKRVDLTIGSSSVPSVDSLSFFVYSDESYKECIDSMNASFSPKTTFSFFPKRVDYWPAGSCYKFTFHLTIPIEYAETYDRYFEFSKVEMYEALFSVSYDANDGIGTAVDANEYSTGDCATVLSGETLSKENYEFIGWNTTKDGSGISYAPGDSLVVEGDTILYAQWERAYFAVTYEPNGAVGTAFTEKVEIADAASYVAASGSAFTNGSFLFDGWATSASGTVVYSAGDSIVLTDDLILYAHWDMPAMQKIASNDGLYDGMGVIIGNADGNKVMGTQGGNNRPAEEATNFVPGAGVVVLTLGVEDTLEGIRYSFCDENGYLYAASSSSNYLKVQTALDDNGRWEIDLASGMVKASGTNTHNLMRYNSSGNLFSCYLSGQSSIALYAMPQTITDEQVANTFIAKYMHMVSAPIGETGTGKCASESWYASAKEAFNKLTEDQRLLVTDNADVYARLQAWAVANGDEMTGDLILATKSASLRYEAGVSQEKNAAAIALITLMGGVAAGSLIFLFRKNKQD